MGEAEKKVFERALSSLSTSRSRAPLRLQAVVSSLPSPVRREAAKKLNGQQRQDNKYERWLGEAIRLPLGKKSDPPPDPLPRFLREARQKMDEAVVGHSSAKEEVTRILCRWKRGGSTGGFALALEGPPGIGKTTFAKAALSQLGRPVVFVALGGAADASLLVGHSYTYEGSLPGKIADSLIKAGTMDPIFVFDEVDKVSNSAKGDELMHVLMAVCDPTQNSEFKDRYFGDIGLDISRATCVFCMNSSRSLPSVLMDRLHLVRLDPPSLSDKKKIVETMVLPRAAKRAGIGEKDVTFTEEAIRMMVERTCSPNGGMRTAEREADRVMGALSVAEGSGSGIGIGASAAASGDGSASGKKVVFPFVCDAETLLPLLGEKEEESPPPAGMFA